MLERTQYPEQSFNGEWYEYRASSEPTTTVRSFAPDEEIERLLTTTDRLSWYANNGYLRELWLPDPQNPSRPIAFDLADSATVLFWQEALTNTAAVDHLSRYLRTQLVQESYLHTLHQLWHDFDRVQQGIAILAQNAQQWDINLPKQFFEFTVSHWGMWGSYDTQNNRIIIRSDSPSRPMGPSLTAMHETVHLAIETKIVRANSLTQMQKEAVVDGIMLHSPLAYLFPEYADAIALYRSPEFLHYTKHLHGAFEWSGGDPRMALRYWAQR